MSNLRESSAIFVFIRWRFSSAIKSYFCHSAPPTTIADNVVIGVVGNIVMAPQSESVVCWRVAPLEVPVGHAVIGVNSDMIASCCCCECCYCPYGPSFRKIPPNLGLAAERSDPPLHA